MRGRPMGVGSLHWLEETQRLSSLFIDMTVVIAMSMFVIVISMRMSAGRLVWRMDGVAHGGVPESACCQVNTL